MILGNDRFDRLETLLLQLLNLLLLKLNFRRLLGKRVLYVMQALDTNRHAIAAVSLSICQSLDDRLPFAVWGAVELVEEQLKVAVFLQFRREAGKQ